MNQQEHERDEKWIIEMAAKEDGCNVAVGTQAPTENDSPLHEAQGNLAFLLSVIRSGETLHPDEEANVRRVIALPDIYKAENAALRSRVEELERERAALHLSNPLSIDGIHEILDSIKGLMRIGVDAALERYVARLEKRTSSVGADNIFRHELAAMRREEKGNG